MYLCLLSLTGRARVDQRPGQKKVKDPNKPKRATSAYFFFLADCREQAKKAGRSLSKVLHLNDLIFV